VFDDGLTQLLALPGSKPISVPEVSVTTRNGLLPPYGTVAEKAAWITAYFAYVKTKPIKLSVWSNVDYGNYDDGIFSQPNLGDPYSAGDCTFTSGGATYNAYCMYKQAISDAYFTSAVVVSSRILAPRQW